MDSKTVTLFDLNDKPVDTVVYPINGDLEPGAILVYQGRRFARGGGPNNFYGANEYAELRKDEDHC